jgi:hypothetical protein
MYVCLRIVLSRGTALHAVLVPQVVPAALSPLLRLLSVRTAAPSCPPQTQRPT